LAKFPSPELIAYIQNQPVPPAVAAVDFESAPPRLAFVLTMQKMKRPMQAGTTVNILTVNSHLT